MVLFSNYYSALAIICSSALAFASSVFSPSKTVIDCSELTSTKVGSPITFSLKALSEDDSACLDNSIQLALAIEVVATSPINRLLDAGNPKREAIVASLSAQEMFYDFGRNDGTFSANFTLSLAGTLSLSVLQIDPNGNRIQLGSGQSAAAKCPFSLIPESPVSGILTTGSVYVQLTAGDTLSIPVNGLDAYGNPTPLQVSDVFAVASFSAFDPLSSTTASRSITISYSELTSDSVSVNVLTLVTGTINLQFVLYGSINPLASEPNPNNRVKLSVPVQAGLSDIASSGLLDASFFSQARKTSLQSVTLLISERDSNGNGIKPGQDNRTPYVLRLVNATSGGGNNKVVQEILSTPGGNPSVANYHVIQFGPITRVGSFVVHISRSDLEINGSPLNNGNPFTVTAGFIEPVTSSLLVSTPGFTNHAIVATGSTLQISIVAMDPFNNPGALVSQSDVDQLDVTAVNSQTGESISATSQFSVTGAAQNGIISLVLNLEKPGNYTVFASLFLIPLSNDGKIQFFAQSESSSVRLFGEGASSCVAESVCRFALATYDSIGNLQYLKTDDSVSVRLNSQSGDALVNSVNVTSLGGGTYAVSYYAQKSGSVQGEIIVNGAVLKTFPLNISMKESTKGILIGTAVVTSICAAFTAFVVHRHLKFRKMHRQWEGMKQAAYKEYDVGSGGDGKNNNTSGGGKTLKNGLEERRSGTPVVVQQDEEWNDDANTDVLSSTDALNPRAQATIPDDDWQTVESYVKRNAEAQQ